MKGVLQHELVHCFQNNGKGTCPGGLIEGMAGVYSCHVPDGCLTKIPYLDFVRLQRKFIPPHWKREPGDKWDAGYQSTAYFLEWLDQTFGEGHVRRLNESLAEAYEESVWTTLTGHTIESLWKKYLHEYK